MPKEIWLDPTMEEAKAAQGTFTIAFVPALGIVTNVWQTGHMSIEEVEKVGTARSLVEVASVLNEICTVDGPLSGEMHRHPCGCCSCFD